ncbi:hypothetical protein [Rheinheimera sp. 4Y26]|nr:hypothetical protein [Rheinheimera sp. 4Y26]MCT6700869.1 hypothetical protein [Rheinheimera sp. 4Y26]
MTEQIVTKSICAAKIFASRHSDDANAGTEGIQGNNKEKFLPRIKTKNPA